MGDLGREIRMGIEAGIKAGIGVGIRAGIRMGTIAGTKTGTRVDIKAGKGVGIEQANKREKDLGQGDEGDPIRVQSFTSRSFLIAARLFFFFNTFSSESMTT